MRKIGIGFLCVTVFAGVMAVVTARADCLQWSFDRWNNPHCLSWGWVDDRYPGGYVPPQAYGYPYQGAYMASPYYPPVYEVPPVPPALIIPNATVTITR